jgi:hypothetical protein
VRSLFALAFLLCLAGTDPAWASSAKKTPGHGKADAEAARELGVPSDPNIDMPGLVSPVIVDGELHRYVYLSLKLKLSDIGQRSTLLEKVPYLQDAFLREVHGASIAYNSDPSIVDEAGVLKRLMHVCEAVVGAGVVKEIEIMKAARSGH